MKLRLREKTTATLLIAIFMMSTLSVISVGAYTADEYKTAVLDAADRIILGQNDDGGFDWDLIEGDSTSYTNLGISAIGVLKAYKLDPRSSFKTSLAEAYMYAVNNAPGWVQDGTKWKEDPNGVNSWPDVTFILELARAAAKDSSLLSEIGTLTGDTVSDMAAYAKFLWDDRVNHMGNPWPEETGGSVTAMATYLRDDRLSGPTPLIGIVPWDIEEAVKAALALEDYYSEIDYGLQATELATFIYDYIYTDNYFNIQDSNVVCYTIGLTGALEAFTEAGVYSVKASEIKGLLIGYQKSDGSWQESDTDLQYIVQPTAYAIMALLAQGDVDAQASAYLGVEWLISAQEDEGGWLEAGDEYPELNSEAAWALFNSILKSNFVPGNGKGLDKPIPNDNFAKGRRKE